MDKMKVLIVDDEYLIRNLLKLRIRWEDFGMEIVGEASSAREALDLTDELQPDIIFTDICMPFMDGIELSRIVIEKYPYIKIVIITGHDEFEYAKKSIKLGISDFLLKPINAEEIKKVATGLQEKIIREKSREKEYEELKQCMDESLPYIKEKVLYELLQGELDIEDMKDKLSFFNIEMNEQSSYFQTAVIEVSPSGVVRGESQENRIFLNIQCMGLVKTVFREDKYIHVFFDYIGKIILLSNNDDIDLTECCEVIKTQIINKYKCNICIGIGNRVQGLGNISRSCKEAEDALRYKVIVGKNQVINYKDINFTSNDVWENSPGKNDKLRFSLKAGQKDKILELLDELLPESVFNRGGTMERIRLEAFEILLTCQHVLFELNISVGDIWKNSTQPYEDISGIDNLPELKRYLEEMLFSIADKINCSNKKRTNRIIAGIKEYIQNNLHQPDLSPAGIAKEFFISPSHLSRLFKQETTQTLVEYITKIRIDKAVSLLKETDLKVYQIGECVGISDPHYFSIIFKKNTGSSVNDFRKGRY